MVGRWFVVLLIVFSAVAGGAAAEDKAEKAMCAVCEVRGETEPEKVAATTVHDGITYSFCAEHCKSEFASDPAAYSRPTLPRPAPAFAVEALAGHNAALADFAGQVVLVDFWATWCKPCTKLMPQLQRLYDAHADDGFTVMGVAIDEGEDRRRQVQKYLAKHEVTYPAYLDTKETPAWYLYGVKAVPAMFLIDRGGQIVAQWRGAVDHQEVAREVTRLLTATVPAPGASR